MLWTLFSIYVKMPKVFLIISEFHVLTFRKSKINQKSLLLEFFSECSGQTIEFISSITGLYHMSCYNRPLTLIPDLLARIHSKCMNLRFAYARILSTQRFTIARIRDQRTLLLSCMFILFQFKQKTNKCVFIFILYLQF